MAWAQGGAGPPPGGRAAGQGLGPRQGARLSREGQARGACGCRLESSWPHISEWDGSHLRGADLSRAAQRTELRSDCMSRLWSCVAGEPGICLQADMRTPSPQGETAHLALTGLLQADGRRAPLGGRSLSWALLSSALPASCPVPSELHSDRRQLGRARPFFLQSTGP